ncbi:MAG: hypothetical protein AB7H97_00700 [Pseudobdellovibrionaceae bacterium]
MKTAILFLLMFIVGCTSDKIDKWSLKGAECKDKSKGTISFREACRGALPLGYESKNNGADFKRWCQCAEEKIAFPVLLNEKCEVKVALSTIVQITNDDSVKEACGKPNDPL